MDQILDGNPSKSWGQAGMNSPNDHAELTSRTQKAIYMQKVKVT